MKLIFKLLVIPVAILLVSVSMVLAGSMSGNAPISDEKLKTDCSEYALGWSGEKICLGKEMPGVSSTDRPAPEVLLAPEGGERLICATWVNSWGGQRVCADS